MTKENDLFLNSIVNPNFTAYDFNSIGLNTDNTGIATDMDSYKDNEIVKKAFTKPDGSFDEDTFKKRYQYAQYMYNGLDNPSIKEAIESTTFHRDNIFVPASQRKKGPDFNISFMPNPLEQQKSVNILGRLSVPAFSVDEIAQRNKVLANPVEVENGADPIWHDAPNDSFFTDFWDTRVLAQWDYDADIDGNQTDDPTEIAFHKGEYKLNEDGAYYYENLDGRDIYGRKVLNKFNTLTTDGSYWNQFDFFDSDDMEQKSVGGTLMKNIALVAPMFIPYVGSWIAIGAAAIQSTGLLATLGKMFLGSDSPKLSAIEGWVDSIDTKNLKTEYAQQHMWCWENYIDLVGDVVAQVRQQRAIFKDLPALFKGTKADEKGLEALRTKLTKELDVGFEDFNKKIIAKKAKNEVAFSDIAELTKLKNITSLRVNDAIEAYQKSYNKIGSVISKSWMVGITVGDTYGEAKAQGASDLEATLLTLGYGAAEAWLLNTGIGEWMMPELRVGRKMTEAIGKAATEAKKIGHEMEAATKTSINEASKGVKKEYVKRIFNAGKKAFKDLYNGELNVGKSFAGNMVANAFGEGVEEVSEEMLADFSKGCFDLVSWLRGDDTILDCNWWNKQEGVTIGTALSDYAMNFFGGLLGGGIAGMDINITSQLKEAADMTSDKAIQKIIHMVRNGESDKFLKEIEKGTIGDKTKSIRVDPETGIPKAYDESDPTDMSQDQAAKKMLRQQVEAIKYLLDTNGINISDNSLLKQYKELIPSVKESTLIGMAGPGRLLDDFRKTSERILFLSSQIETLEGASVAKTDSAKRKEEMEKEDANDDKSTERQNTLKRYRDDLAEAIKERDSILNGERFVRSIEKTLAELTIGQSWVPPNFIRWAEMRKKQKFNEINKEELPALQEEYQEWKKTEKGYQTDEYTDLIINLARKTTDAFKSHSKNYKAHQKNSSWVKAFEQYFYYRFSDILDKKMMAANKQIDNAADFMDQVKKEVMPENILRDFVEYAAGVRTERQQNDWNTASEISKKIRSTPLVDLFKSDFLNEEEQNIAKELINTLDKAIDDNNEELIKITQNQLNTFAAQALTRPENLDRIIDEYTQSPDENEVHGLGFMNHVIKNGLLKMLYSAKETMTFDNRNRPRSIKVMMGGQDSEQLAYEKKIDYIDEKIEQIKKIPQTPIEDAFDQFVLATTGRNLKLSELLTQLDKTFKGLYTGDLTMFNYNDYGDSVDNAINLLNLFIKSVEALRVDNGDLSNIFGFSKAINQIRQKVKESDKYKDVEDVEPYLELDSDLADLYTQDAYMLKSHLEFYKNLYFKASGQTMTAQTRIADKLDLILYDRIKRLSVCIPDDWDGKDALKDIIESCDLLQNYQGKHNTITSKDRIKLRNQMFQVETAIYDFFQKNASKLKDVNAVKKFILGSSSHPEDNFDLFTNPVELVNENSDKIDDNAFFWWITTRVALDPRVFYKGYYELLKEQQKTDDPIAPIYTQRMAEYTNIAHVANSQLFETFTQALKLATKEKWKSLDVEDKKNIVENIFHSHWVDKTFGKEYDDYILTMLPLTKYTNTIFVEGAAGTGKSAAVSKVTFAFIKKYMPQILNNKKILVGHGVKIDKSKYPSRNENERAIEFAKSLGLNPEDENVECLAGDNLIRKLIPYDKYNTYNKNTNNSFEISENDLKLNKDNQLIAKNSESIRKDVNYGIIVVDEIQNFSTLDLDILDSYATKNKISNIVCGHLWQSGVIGRFELNNNLFQKASFDLEFNRLNAIRTLPLGFSMRVSCSEKRKNNIEFEKYMELHEKNKYNLKDVLDVSNAITLSYSVDQNGLHGDVILDRDREILEDGTIGDETKEILEAMFNNLPEGEKVGFITDTTNSVLYKYLASNYRDKFETFLGNSANGLEGKYYILDIPQRELDGSNDDLKESRPTKIVTDEKGNEVPVYISSYDNDLYTAFTRAKEGCLIFVTKNDDALSEKFVSRKSNSPSVNVSVNPNVIKNFTQEDIEIYDEILKDVKAPETISVVTLAPTTNGKVIVNKEGKLGLTPENERFGETDSETEAIEKEIRDNGGYIYANNTKYQLDYVARSKKTKKIYVNVIDTSNNKRCSYEYKKGDTFNYTPTLDTESPIVSSLEEEFEPSGTEKEEQEKVRKLNKASHNVIHLSGHEGRRDNVKNKITYIKGYTEFVNETGLSEEEWNGNEDKPKLEDSDPRIDSIHGLYKLQKLFNPNIKEPSSKSLYIKVLGQLHSAMNNSEYTNINDLNKAVISILKKFLNVKDLNLNIRFAFEGKIPGYENKGDFTKFNQNKQEYNISGELVDVQRKKISMIISKFEDNKQIRLLSIPFMTLANPLSIATEFTVDENGKEDYNNPELVECLKTALNSLGIDTNTKTIPEILKSVEEAQKNGQFNNLDFYNAFKTEIAKIHGYDNFISFIDLYLITNNMMLEMPSDWCPGWHARISTPTSVFGDRNANYVNGKLRNKQISFVDLETIANNPALQMSSVMFLSNKTFKYDDGETFEHSYQPGHPCVLISSDISLNNDEKIVNYFKQQERNAELPKKVTLVYVLPPNLSVEKYIDRLHTKLTTSADKLRGLNLPFVEDTFTTEAILYRLFCSEDSQEFIDKFMTLSKNFNYSDKFLEVVKIIADKLFIKPDVNGKERSEENRKQYGSLLDKSISDDLLKTTIGETTISEIIALNTGLSKTDLQKKPAGFVIRSILESLVYIKGKTYNKNGEINIAEKNIEAIDIIKDFLESKDYKIYYRVKADSAIQKVGEFSIITKGKSINLNNEMLPFRIHGDVQTTSGKLTFNGTLNKIIKDAKNEMTKKTNNISFVNNNVHKEKRSYKKPTGEAKKHFDIALKKLGNYFTKNPLLKELKKCESAEEVVDLLRENAYIAFYNEHSEESKFIIHHINSPKAKDKFPNKPITIYVNGEKAGYRNFYKKSNGKKYSDYHIEIEQDGEIILSGYSEFVREYEKNGKKYPAHLKWHLKKGKTAKKPESETVTEKRDKKNQTEKEKIYTRSSTTNEEGKEDIEIVELLKTIARGTIYTFYPINDDLRRRGFEGTKAKLYSIKRRKTDGKIVINFTVDDKSILSGGKGYIVLGEDNASYELNKSQKKGNGSTGQDRMCDLIEEEVIKNGGVVYVWEKEFPKNLREKGATPTTPLYYDSEKGVRYTTSNNKYYLNVYFDVKGERKKGYILLNESNYFFDKECTKPTEYGPDSINKFINTSGIEITKIISGGQTGVDTIGLKVAKKLGIVTGGTAPKGFKRVNKKDGVDIKSYGLTEQTTDEEKEFFNNHKNAKDRDLTYNVRTWLNVKNSDGTVIFTTEKGKNSTGTKATIKYAEELEKPYLINPTANELADWIKSKNIKVLNVAGNRNTTLDDEPNRATEIEQILIDALNLTIPKVPSVIDQLISHLERLGIRVHNTAEMKAFLKENGVDSIEQYVKDQKEMDAIKQKAIADGTFMKAPNGKPTNLTERQWLQVRTTNFKNWFGDWENDPANASKVVDENGEPLVVYHGGKNNISTFVTYHQDDEVGDMYGAYFTKDKNYAKSYNKGALYEVFLNIRKPLATEGKWTGVINKDRATSITGKYDGIVNDKFDNGILNKLHLAKTRTEIIVFNPNQIKSATANNGDFSLTNNDIDLFITKNNRNTIESWLNKWEKTQPDAETAKETHQAVMDFIDTIDNNVVQLAYAKWFCNGTVRFGEAGLPNTIQAVELAKKNKVDPLSYSSPMEIIEKFKDTIKEKPINPDTVKTLHRAKEIPEYGLVIYDVDESKESRQNMRQIINTHYGKDCSPWCLLQGDENGNLTELSAHYWYDTYNAYPKQVVFRNGKLLAFSANDREKRLWWDRQDKSHGGIPITGKIEGDELGRSGTFSINPETGQASAPYNMYKGNKQNGVYEEWYDNGQLKHRYNFKNGKRDGLSEGWYLNGQLAFRHNFKDGKEDGLCEEWYFDGQLAFRHNFKDGKEDGLCEEWYFDGQLRYRHNFKDGKKDGLCEEWYFDGQLAFRTYYKNGYIISHEAWDRFGRKKEEDSYSVENLKDIETFATPQGEIYGFVDADGEVYFDKDAKGFSSEHVVHEYTHLWDRVIQKKNPKFWARGVYLMQHGAASLWNDIADSPQYGKKWIAMGLSGTELENKIASEVHARLTGEKGKELIEKIEKEQGPSGIIGKLKKWLKKFWGKLRETFGVWTDRDLANIELDDFVNMPIRDFITEVDLDKAKEVVYKEDVEPEESFTWARISPNSYEVSSKGDKRFSALNATFEPGTIVEGVDVGGKTIEWVYQNVIKKSKKGQPPAKTSRLNLNPTRVSEKNRVKEFEYVQDKLGKPISFSTNDGIITVVFEKDSVEVTPSIGMVKISNGKFVGNDDIKYFVGTLKAVENLSGTAEDFSYTEGYLPLWQLWAKQHPELIADLKEKARGKVLTDQFANTRVSQARALAEILNSIPTDTSENGTDTSENGANFASEEAHKWANEVVTVLQEAIDNSNITKKNKDFLQSLVDQLIYEAIPLGQIDFNSAILRNLLKNNVSLQKLEAYAKVYPDDVITLDTWAREKGFGSDTDNSQPDETLPWEEEETDTGSDTDNSQPDMEYVNRLANKIYNRFSDRAAEAHRKGDDNYEQLHAANSAILGMLNTKIVKINITAIKQFAEKFGIDTTEIKELEEIINKEENKDFCSINTVVIDL